MEPIGLKPRFKGYIGTLFISGVLGIVALISGIGLSFYSFDIGLGLAGIGIVLLLYSSLTPIYLRKTSYEITDKAVIKDRETLLSENHEKIPLDKIENTTLKRGFIQKMLGSYGTISISTAGSGQQSSLRLYAIENAQDIHKRLLTQTTSSRTPETLKENTNEKESDVYTEAKKLNKATKKLRDIVTNN